MLIKPFVRLFSTLLQPFRKLAYGLMKTAAGQEGGMASGAGRELLVSALGIMIAGTMASILPVLGNLFSMFIVNPIFELLKAVLPMFSGFLETARVGVNDGISKVTMGVYDATLTSMTNLATNLNTKFASIDVTSGANNAAARGVAAVNAFWDEMAKAAAARGKYSTTGKAAQAYVTSSTFDQAASAWHDGYKANPNEFTRDEMYKCALEFYYHWHNSALTNTAHELQEWLPNHIDSIRPISVPSSITIENNQVIEVIWE